MPKFEIDDLIRLLIESAGEDDSIDLSGDIADKTFDTLGYDSLALFNLVSYVQREYDVQLDDEIVSRAKTPRELLVEVNESLSQTV